MEIRQLKFEKGTSKIEISFVFCECGGMARNKSWVGCSHSEEYSYFYQCPKCKNIEIYNNCVERESLEDLEKAGWELIITNKENK